MASTQQTVFIPGPAGSLETLVYAPAAGSAVAVAVVLHPNPVYGGSNLNKVVQTLARALLAKNYLVYLPNLRGVGKSAGCHDFGVGESKDVEAVAAYIGARHPHLPQTLAGFSFGAYVAIRVSKEITCRRFILVGAAVGKYEQQTLTVPPDRQILLIHGENDEIIPLSTLFAWARPQNLPVTVVLGASHFFHRYLTVLREIVTAFAA